MGWLAVWDQRVRVTIDQTDITAALTDFPVLIYLSSSSGRNSDDVTCVFDEVGANSLKIAVTTSDGTTECYVEVEKWDNGNEKAWLWVKVPSVSSTADTDLYLYYDNAHADNVDKVGAPNSVPAENVWDSSFEFVSHMRDDPDTSHIRDSTTNDNDGTKVGAANPAVSTSGIIGECQSFDGSDTIGITDIAALGSQQTIEAWVKVSFSTGMNMYVWEEGSNRYQIQLYDGDDSNGQPKIAFHSFLNADTSNLPTSDVWYYIVATVNGTAIAVYVNGVLDWSDPASRPEQAPGNIVIGNYGGGGGYYFTGLMDEVRCSSTPRSAAWIKASYESGRDDLVSFSLGGVPEIFTEAVSLTDSSILIVQDIFAILSEAVTLSDTYERLISIRRLLTETVAISDSVFKGVETDLIETITLSDALLRISGLERILTEIITLSDALLRQLYSYKTLMEAATLSDNLLRVSSLYKILTDVMSLKTHVMLFASAAIQADANKNTDRNPNAVLFITFHS